ncbi:MAG: amphi-Trp domain-containing protein [Desulfobacterales bacterium]|nr:amphi-Trp domain-containing protein [Desulfobacterales bacterium]
MSEKFVYDSLQDGKSIGALLESLAQGFSSGHLDFEGGGQKIHLSSEGLLNVVIKAKKKGNRSKVNLSISWQTEEGTGG